ncbi:MAG: class I SAM-dependent methyltransferase [Anaerolineae bacterium]|jgi:ubiquinone/menaquinone biosynthesis C-methylase UbiE|nr:class I SAM-dependent methyltransferase [Anaerolineae bacterium]
MGSITPDISNRGVIKRAWWNLVRFGFRLLYNEMAFTYDAVAWAVSLGQWRAWQRCALKHLDAPPGATILELAHGTGNLEIDLHAAGYHTAALDLSRAMGCIARRKLRRRGIPLSLVRGQAQALPFPSNCFPAAVSTFPTDFIIDPATLAEIHRVLQPGGRLVVVFNGVLTHGSPAKNALEFAYRVTGQRGPWPVDVEQRLTNAGFRGSVVTEELGRSRVLLFVVEKAGG